MRRTRIRSIIGPVIATFAVTAGIAAGALVFSAAVTAVLARLLGRLEAPAHPEPDWWPGFERAFAEYVTARRR